MNLKKLILAGAYTVAGDVLYFHPVRRQVLIGTWSGGEDVELNALGRELIDEIVPSAPKRKAAKAEE